MLLSVDREGRRAGGGGLRRGADRDLRAAPAAERGGLGEQLDLDARAGARDGDRARDRLSALARGRSTQRATAAGGGELSVRRRWVAGVAARAWPCEGRATGVGVGSASVGSAWSRRRRGVGCRGVGSSRRRRGVAVARRRGRRGVASAWTWRRVGVGVAVRRPGCTMHLADHVRRARRRRTRTSRACRTGRCRPSPAPTAGTPAAAERRRGRAPPSACTPSAAIVRKSTLWKLAAVRVAERHRLAGDDRDRVRVGSAGFSNRSRRRGSRQGRARLTVCERRDRDRGGERPPARSDVAITVSRS